MKFYRHWIKCTRDIPLPGTDGKMFPMSVYGHSNISLEDAKASGQRLLDAFAKRIVSQLSPWEYDRDDRPIREETLLELSSRNIVTRNRYGAEVLNSTQLVFIDVDGALPSGKGFFGWLGGLFSAKSPEDSDTEALARVARLAGKAGHARTHIRVYRTKAGYRLMLLNCDTEGKYSGDLMKAFHADPTYARLCRIQNCFRARLTPKPYRIRQRKIRFNFPETDAEVLEKQHQWLAEYNEKITTFATCRYIGSLNGPNGIAVNDAARYHDERTNAMTNLPLA